VTTGIRLRTKFLLSLILVSSGLTWTTLLIVRHRVQQRVRLEIDEALRNSVVTFQNVQRQREAMLARSGGLLADLPNLRALMTTQDEATIQDASGDLWELAGGDLFVLADPSGKLMALQTSAQGLDRRAAQESLRHSLQNGGSRDWWFVDGHLYEVFLQPVYFGPQTVLGVLAIGYEIGPAVAAEVSQIASSQVAFRYGKTLVVSTLAPGQRAQLAHQIDQLPDDISLGTQDVQLGGERFLGTSVRLPPGGRMAVSLTVLKSYDEATRFLESLNRWLLVVGIAAVLAGSLLVFLISHTFTRPLGRLVAGVRALEQGDFAYPLNTRSGDEVGELTSAFARMRSSLQQTQQALLSAERLATMGRMASAISHDLRHPLTAILAYAEFLSEGNLPERERKDFFQEIRLAVNRMADLISSMLEFSRTRKTLKPVQCNIEDSIRSTIQMIQTHPEFRRIAITIWHEGRCEGWFDPKKLERVFHNLLLNACEAVSPETGTIEIRIKQTASGIEIRIADNGPGIPEPIRATIFQPFVSYGKENGTGLGLAVAQKMIEDHGGRVCVERSDASGTVFSLTLPVNSAPETTPAR
jgi:signal transduction histidine kinase